MDGGSMPNFYYHATNVERLPEIHANGLVAGRHHSSGTATLLFTDQEEASWWADASHGKQGRILAIPAAAVEVAPPGEAPSTHAKGGVFTFGDIAPEHLNLVPMIVAPPVMKPPRSAHGGSEERVMRAGFMRIGTDYADGGTSYVRSIDGGSLELAVIGPNEGDALLDLRMYLQSDGQKFLLRTWNVGEEMSVAYAISEVLAFADGIEQFRKAQLALENDRGMRP